LHRRGPCSSLGYHGAPLQGDPWPRSSDPQPRRRCMRNMRCWTGLCNHALARRGARVKRHVCCSGRALDGGRRKLHNVRSRRWCISTHPGASATRLAASFALGNRSISGPPCLPLLVRALLVQYTRRVSLPHCPGASTLHVHLKGGSWFEEQYDATDTVWIRGYVARRRRRQNTAGVREYVEGPFAKTVVRTLANNRNPATRRRQGACDQRGS
jgi:hypothetical protein